MADDDWGDDFAEERFGRRKDRRKPQGGRRRRELAGEAAVDGSPAFDDPGLKRLYEMGHLTELGTQVRGGKEATVYRAKGPAGPLAAKVYSDVAVRGFKADDAYSVGRRVADRRVRKMLGDAQRRGLTPELAHWVFHEYLMLWLTLGAGIRVPRPAVGPQPDEMLAAGRVVLMEWIGDEEPAPRLSEVSLEQAVAQRAWEIARRLPAALLELGLVHGDLSAFNMLWWQGDLILIDLPQTVEVERNPHAADLLARDIRSLCSSFRPFGVDDDPEELLLETRRATGYASSGPLRR